MARVHSLLRRQLRRWFGEPFDVPPSWQDFVQAVDDAYREFDTDRAMLERSLELSSQELLQANSELRAIFQAIPDLVFRIDRDGVILSLKAGGASDLLFEQGRYGGLRIQAIPDERVGSLFREAVERMATDRTAVSLEYSLTPAGSQTPSTYEARFAPLLERESIVIIRNITKRRQAEDELRAAHRRLIDIIDFLPDATFVVDQDKRVTAWNQAIEEMTGVAKAAIVGRGDYAYAEAFHGQRRPVLLDLIDVEHPESPHFHYIRRRGRSLFAETFLPRAFGGVGAHVWLAASPLFDRDGNRVGAIESVRDITEGKRLEEQFRQVQKMEAFGQLAAGVAHDFNNIITTIQGNLSLLELGDLSEAEAASARRQADLAAGRAANLTRQLLTFSRRQPIQVRRVDLNEVVANVTRMLQRLIGEHIALEAHYAPGGAPVAVDTGMIEQVLTNLAVNARDAMPRGGSLTIETAGVAFDEVTRPPLESARVGPYIRLRVSDTGCGIPPENLPQIFEPFFTTKEVGRGTGLGLATVFGIVQQHNGWIDVESTVGEGSTFLVYLPRRSADAGPGADDLPPIEVPRGTETILLVEDEHSVRRLLRSVLQRYGYRVFEAVSGVAALEVWAAHAAEIDLLVSDMVMPGGIGGRELADRLRREKPALKVIYCSGYTDDMLGSDSPLRHDVNFLEKPFDPRKLLLRVRACLDAPGDAAAPR